jgi:hypothetical protein
MTREDIIAAIDEEISRLEKVKDLLQSSSSGKLSGALARKTSAPRKRNLSPEARARIAAAQKRRWAKQKAATTQSANKK